MFIQSMLSILQLPTCSVKSFSLQSC